MSSIQKYDNKYRVQFRYNGKRYSKVLDTKRECRSWVITEIEKLNQEANEHIQLDISTITLAEMLIRYSAEYLEIPKKRSERIRLNKFLTDNDKMVSKPLNSITKGDMREWLHRRAKEVSSTSVRKEVSILNKAYRIAINEWDFDIVNPLNGLIIPSSKPPRERYIEDWEVNSLLLQIKFEQAIPLENIKLRVGAAFLFSLETAMRAGEICNLEWDDISPSGLVLKVKTAKTRSGIREVPLSSKARKIIEQCKLENDTPKVFRLTTAQLDANFRKYRKEAKLKGFTFHDSRATAITKLAKKLDILDLAKMVGHKDPKMLMVYYRQGAEALVDRLG